MRYIVALFVAVVTACDGVSKTSDMDNKSAYAVLQAYEYEFRDAAQTTPVLVFTRAKGTDFSVVGFPIKTRSRGYAFVLASDDGSVKVLPDEEFTVSREAYATARAQASLSKELDSFIEKRVR